VLKDLEQVKAGRVELVVVVERLLPQLCVNYGGVEFGLKASEKKPLLSGRSLKA
jgi:hypothetical protein